MLLRVGIEELNIGTKMKSKIPSSNSQLLLSLPREWVGQLDALAKSRNVTRISLIRLFLRLQMDSELAQLAAHFKQQDEHRRTFRELNSHLNDRDF